MGLSLLIVDDEPEVSDLIARWIRMEAPHFSIAGVESGEDCLEYLKYNHVDCILSDYQMSGINGMELLNTLRTQGNNVPFIFITAQGSEEVAREAFKNGADDYFTKDIGFAHFTRIINSVEQSVKKRRVERSKSYADAALQENEERFRTLFEAADDGIFLQDDGIFVDCNMKAVEMYGFEEKSDIIGHHPMEFAPPLQPDGESSKEKALRFIAAALNGAPQKFYWNPQRRDGTLFDVEVSLSRLVLKGKTYIQAIVRDITARKKAEEALRQNEERMFKAQRMAHVGNWELDIVNNKLYWSDEVYRIYGRDPERFIPTFESVKETMHPDDRGPFLEALKAATLERKPLDMDYRLIRPDGTERTVHTLGEVTYDHEGKPVKESGTLQDITERKQVEESLLLFRHLLNESKDAIFVNDPASGRFLFVNDKACANLGYDRRELLGLRTIDIESIFPDQAKWDAHVHEVRNKGHMILEGVQKRKDGTTFPVEVNVTYTASGEADYMVAVVRDITERRQAEAALQDSEERFRTLFVSADDGIFLVDGPVFVDCNSRGLEMYGFDDKSEIIGHSFLEFAPSYQPGGESSEEMTLRVIPTVLNGTPQKFNWTSARSDGTLFESEVSLNRLVLKGRTYIQAIVRDITARKQAEEALIFKNVLLSAQQEATLDGILMVDPDGKIISYNKRFFEIWNIPVSQEVLDTKSDELAIQSVLHCLKKPEEFLERVNYLYEHRTETSRDEFQLKDGRTFDRYTAPMFGADGKYYGRVWYLRDITDLKNLERQRADFYAMVTHDLKSPLTAILGYSSLISQAAKDKADAGIEEMAKAVVRGVKKLMKIADDFLAGGMEPGSILINPVPVDVAGLLREVRDDFVQLKRQKSIVLRVDISDSLPEASFDKKHFERAVGNLLQNAFNYTPKKGKITLKAEAASDGKGRYVIVSVSDTGPGIAPEEQGKIFNKYYRSPKTAGIKGSGLGLAIVKAVAEAHGGRVELESEVGKGSTFRLVLPIANS